MTSEWKNYKIKDVLSYVVDNRGKTPPIQDEGFELLEVNAISATEKFPQYQLVRKHVSEHVYNTWFRSGHPKIGDILVPTVGTLGAVSYVNKDNCCIAQNLIALRANKDICDCDYLYYILRNPNTRKRLLNLNIGGVQPSIKVPHLMDLEIGIPPVEIQKKIISILKVLDDKISINQKTNDNLSEMLQSIYQQRFNITNNDEERGALADICDYSKDRISVSSLSVSNYYSTENMLPGKAGAVDASSLPTIAQTTKCKTGDVLISNIRPYFRKIVYCQSDCGCSTDVLCFTPKSSALSAYLFSTLYADRFFDFMVAGSKGTKMPRGDKHQIMTYAVHIPTDDELDDFNELAKPLLAQIESNRLECISLSALRDGLLPKLMSGEVDVSDINI